MLRDALVLVEDVGEAGVRLLELDHATRLELPPQVEQDLRDVGPAVELGFDPHEHAAPVPERAVLARTPLGVPLCDQLDRAELPVLHAGLHGGTVTTRAFGPIGAGADRAAGRYGPATIRGVDAFDLDVRRHVYFSVVTNGRPPSTAETATAFRCDEAEIADAYRRLHDAHALVLYPDSTEVWMANPFCFAPTPNRVTAGGREWTGTCAWDALGIPGALHTDGNVASECACCGQPLELEVRGGELARGAELLVHFVVPARRWWDDIGFT